MSPKDLESVSTKELMNFSNLVGPLVKYIRKSWSWKRLKPKGYKESRELYLNDESIPRPKTKFKGIDSSTCSSFGFHEKTKLFQVLYDDVDQGRDPLTTLIASSVGFGMVIEQERSRRAIKKAINKHNKSVRRYCKIGKQTIKEAKEAATSEEAMEIMLREFEGLINPNIYEVCNFDFKI